MKKSNVVTSSVLLFNGLLFLVLGARVWSAPDVFTDGLGLMPAAQSTIDTVGAMHGGSFVGLGAAALGSAFAPVLLRWVGLLLLTVLGAAAYTWLWSISGGGYATLLYGVAAINLVTLVTAFVGEPMFGAGARNANADDNSVNFRWG